MSNRNGSIREYFRPAQLQSPATSSTPATSAAQATHPATATANRPTLRTPIATASQPSELTAKSNPPARQRVVRSSDDEDSDSDSSIEDLTEIIRRKISKHNATVQENDHPTNSKSSRSRSLRKNAYFPSPPAKTKYKFDMKRLIHQAEKDEAIQASAQRVNALLSEASAKTSLEATKSSDVNSDLLGLVVADGDSAQPDDVFQALKRTEATLSDKRCYFFDAPAGSVANVWPCSKLDMAEGWQSNLGDAQYRERTVLSGFARDMVTLGDTLPDEIFKWMLFELCLEMRDDLRRAYCNILSASHQQLHQFVSPEVIANLLRNVGANGNAVDIHQEIQLVPVRVSVSQGHDWACLRVFLTFLGEIAPYVRLETKSYSLSLIVRLCVDREILENIGLFDCVQRSMEHIYEGTADEEWEECVRDVCTSIYSSVHPSSLRFQILRCIPCTVPNLHDLRRRLALAGFFEDISYSTRTGEVALDLYEVTKRLREPQFQITRDTDYHKLAAQMSMLDIVVDNGLSAEYDIADPQGVKEFDADIDQLIARVGNTASNISDAGAAYMSRVDAKEVIEGFRHRLMFAVRTKPQPRKGIFDTATVDDSEDIRKQSELMKKHFRLIKTEEG